MKPYLEGIILGGLSVISGLLFVGIPFGTSLIEIANVAVLVIGAITVLILGIFLKKYTSAVITSAIYMGLLFALTLFIETQMSGSTIVYAGFLPGLSIAVTGLVTSIKMNGYQKILAGVILSVIGILVNIASLVMALMNGFIG